jgi:hypothetical protein
MFKWYQRADVCYAYLQDVYTTSDVNNPDGSFQKSRWFTRGWTLQELLAPGVVYFYTSDWKEIGSRINLKDSISETTGIDAKFFDDGNLTEYTTAQKMFWASRRQTTRTEDQAYCLMGIFNVNMPLLYGEGNKAFSRLQEEILRRSTDYSIFANGRFLALLAPSAAFFGAARNICRKDWPNLGGAWPAATDRGVSITSKGVELTLPILERKNWTASTYNAPEWEHLAVLNCGFEGTYAVVALHESVPGVFSKQHVWEAGFNLIDDKLAKKAVLRTVIF